MRQCELKVADDKTTISWLWLQCLSYVNAMVGTCWTEAAATLVPKLASADGEVRRKRVDDNRRIYSDRESSMKLRR
jgi:hypothetical protein